MNTDIDFEYIEEFAGYIVDRVENNEELFVSVIGKFEEIKNIIKEIISGTEVDFEMLNIQSPNVNGYCDEYILDCWCDDEVVRIGCEPAKQNGRYLNFESDEIYLFSNCSSRIIPLCEGLKLYYINVEEECDCDECCEDCCPCECREDDIFVECIYDGDGNTHGFTASRGDDDEYYSFSYYTSDNLSDDDIFSMLEEHGF